MMPQKEAVFKNLKEFNTYGQFSKGGYRTYITAFSLKNKKISFSLISNFVFIESFSSLEIRNDQGCYGSRIHQPLIFKRHH